MQMMINAEEHHCGHVCTYDPLNPTAFNLDECIKCVMRYMCFGNDVNAFDNTLAHIEGDKASKACLASGENPMTMKDLNDDIAFLKGDDDSPNTVDMVLKSRDGPKNPRNGASLRLTLVGLFLKAKTCIAAVKTCEAAGPNDPCPEERAMKGKDQEGRRCIYGKGNC